MTPDSCSELIVGDDVATITLNRPARLNAIDLPLAETLLQQLRTVAADHSVRAVVVTGRGRAFSAGGDVVALSELIDRGDVDAVRKVLEAGRDVVIALRGMPKPVVAAVNGPAVGAGASLALACDVRIASDEATLSLPFTRLGLHPDWGASHLLPRIAGTGRAMELILTGRTADAHEAERFGIFSRVVPAAALLDTAHELASSLAQLPSEAVGLSKRSVEQSLYSTLDELLAIEVQRQLQCLATAGTKQAITAVASRLRKSTMR